ncbi:MAG: twin-arginine translocation signal domain-containing protein, partial [bacterium]|nr:twin-arginine translocation signal domain-containing protein [bacterium]
MTDVNRRTFVKGTAGAMAAASLIGTSKTWAQANETIRVAVLGVNGRGQSHISAHQQAENVEVVALCDPDSNV